MKKTDEDIRMTNVSKIFKEAEPFINLMMNYKCAVREVETKLYVLNDEYSVRFSRNPFESIKSRIKSPESIIEKLERRGYELTTESIEENLTDVAGIRVICSFVDDIYMLAEKLVQQDDIILIKRKDYIRYPKTNGYRSLHLILDIPIFLSEEKKHMKVEVQFRTIAMDFWASLDHKLRYKKDIDNQDVIVEELKSCADTINEIDCRMQQIRYMMEAQGNVKKLE